VLRPISQNEQSKTVLFQRVDVGRFQNVHDLTKRCRELWDEARAGSCRGSTKPLNQHKEFRMFLDKTREERGVQRIREKEEGGLSASLHKRAEKRCARDSCLGINPSVRMTAGEGKIGVNDDEGRAGEAIIQDRI